MTLLTPSRVRSLLAAHDLAPSRALGQNFLADPNTARRIVRLAGVEAGDNVVEIGPGIGSLTLALAETGARILAVELDQHLVHAFNDVMAPFGEIELVVGDALELDLEALLSQREGSWTMVSNLPYNIATPLVVGVLERVPSVTSMLVMIQREVGERLAAAANAEAYGAVSVKIAYYGAATVVGTVPPTVFIPEPKVDSALVRIVRHSRPPVDVSSTEELFRLVRLGFAQRRKMLRQALRPALGSDATAILETAGIDPTARAETLGLPAWAALAHAVAGRPR